MVRFTYLRNNPFATTYRWPGGEEPNRHKEYGRREAMCRSYASCYDASNFNHRKIYDEVGQFFAISLPAERYCDIRENKG